MIGQLTGKEYTELPQEDWAYIKARPEGLVQDSSSKRTDPAQSVP
jgi:hypothetical protein